MRTVAILLMAARIPLIEETVMVVNMVELIKPQTMFLEINMMTRMVARVTMIAKNHGI